MRNLHALAPTQDASADSEASARGMRAWSTVGVSAAARELPEARASQPGSGAGALLMAGKTGWPAQELMQDDYRPLFRWFASKPDARRLVWELATRILEERNANSGA